MFAQEPFGAGRGDRSPLQAAPGGREGGISSCLERAPGHSGWDLRQAVTGSGLWVTFSLGDWSWALRRPEVKGCLSPWLGTETGRVWTEE